MKSRLPITKVLLHVEPDIETSETFRTRLQEAATNETGQCNIPVMRDSGSSLGNAVICKYIILLYYQNI
jgi:hypothetical protein